MSNILDIKSLDVIPMLHAVLYYSGVCYVLFQKK